MTIIGDIVASACSNSAKLEKQKENDLPILKCKFDFPGPSVLCHEDTACYVAKNQPWESHFGLYTEFA